MKKYLKIQMTSDLFNIWIKMQQTYIDHGLRYSLKVEISTWIYDKSFFFKFSYLHILYIFISYFGEGKPFIILYIFDGLFRKKIQQKCWNITTYYNIIMMLFCLFNFTDY